MTAESVLRQEENLVVLPDDGDPLDIAPEALRNIQKNWFTFSVAAYRIHSEDLFKQRGYENFKEYVEAELDIKYRVAMLRVEMGEAIEMLNLTMEEVGQMGWTKFKYIAPRLKAGMKRKDLLATLRKAENMTVKEIKDFVVQEMSTTKVVSQTTTMTFRLTNEQAEVVKKALEESGALAASESQSVAFEYMASEWLMNHNPKAAEELRKRLSPEAVKPEMPRKQKATSKAAKEKAAAKKKAPAKKKKAPAKKKAAGKKK
jgi:hypothetical protein